MTTDEPNEVGPLNQGWTAILLTGGAGTRMGQEKAGVMLGDGPLVDHVLRGLPSAVEVIVVGPDLAEPPRPVICTRESPAGGGPVAGLAAGLQLVTTQITGVIATDMPFAGGLLGALAQGIPAAADALVPVDGAGRLQPLCAAYRTAALRAAVQGLGVVHGASMRSLLDHLVVAESAPTGLNSAFDPEALFDIDTPSDLGRSRAIMLERKGSRHG